MIGWKVANVTLISSLILVIVSPQSLAQEKKQSDWPRWSGSEFQMISKESNWDSDWKKNPPKKVWEENVGTGYSSVAIVDGKLYTMGRENKQDAVFCLDAKTGKKIWSHTYDAPLFAKMHKGGPGTTPTIADGRVFTLSRDGRVSCLDAKSGSVNWEVETRELTGAKVPTWGFTSSGLVTDGKIIFDVGSILALDVKDGKEVWKTKARNAGYGSVIEFKNGGKTELAVLSNDGLISLDPKTGEELNLADWKTYFKTNSSTPIQQDDKFFISTGYRRGCAMFQYKSGKFKKLYENKNMSNHMNNSVWYKGYIYGINGNSNASRNCTVVCIDAKTGEQQWAERGHGCGSLLIAGDHLLILSDKGVLTCAKATPKGYEPTGKIDAVKGQCWTVPVVCNGMVYCRSAQGNLTCWSLPKK